MARSLVAVALLLAIAALAGAAPPDPLPRSPEGSEHAQGPKKLKPVKKKCKNKDPEYKYCHDVPIECPWSCPDNCYINCHTCSPFCCE
ncbi:hypothetical protein Taro_008495 [Colocasia esculenta]|uniref:Uncharacterized protein n=1 Tax=Colocasia esculenta TaxID=4460 RepID=A0A843U747_COLES|nr:hypothetical protein [Colocasia esculenta]